MRRIALSAAIALGAAVAVLSTPAYAEGPGALRCTVHQVPVTISDGGPLNAAVYGELCYRGAVVPRTVQLTVHGSTYNHLYWDFPYQNTYYSYVRAATLAGYATFNVDRIGAGQSSHPPGLEYDMADGARALHDVITKLRTGSPDTGGHAFSNVIYVGHSYGSIYGWAEVSRYPGDVDAVILTGMLHKISPSFIAQNVLDFITADQDPLFAAIPGVDWSQYLTYASGTRPQFYYQPTAEPNVIAVDDAHRDTVGIRELDDSAQFFQGPADQAPSQRITVPVLLLVGDQDRLFCAPDAFNCADPASIRQFESSYYPPEAHLRVVVIPRTGHNLNLHYTAPVTFAVAQAWALAHVSP
jgi:pimeloyl-ACP methyl ester carboxylesterase